MRNCGFFYKTVTPISRDCRAFIKKHLIIVILSLIWCALGIILGFMECGKGGSKAFVLIYGERFYLIATRKSGVGGVFSAEITVGILIFFTIIFSTVSRYLLWLPDVFFCICCFLKSVTIGHLLTQVGVISKILAVAIMIPCFLMLILWYCCFHGASCEFCPVGWKIGGFKRMWKCHLPHILLFIGLFFLIVVLEFLLFLFFCVLL